MGNVKSIEHVNVKYEFHYVRGDLSDILLDALSERLDERAARAASEPPNWFWVKNVGNQQITVYEMLSLNPLDELKTFYIGTGSKTLYINVKIL
jgi:hypothetical protein